MAITYVSAASAASTSLSMPSHQKGDLLVAFAYNSGGASLAPTVPSGWVTKNSQPRSGGRSGVIAFKTATSASEVSGTWTDATHLAVVVYRSNAGLYLFSGTSSTGSGASASTISYEAIAAANMSSSGSAWVIGCSATTTDDVANTAPSLMTNRTSTASSGEIAMHDTNANVASWATTTVATTSVTYRSFCMEIYETDIVIPTGGSGGVPLIGTGGLVY